MLTQDCLEGKGKLAPSLGPSFRPGGGIRFGCNVASKNQNLPSSTNFIPGLPFKGEPEGGLPIHEDLSSLLDCYWVGSLDFNFLGF